MTGCVLLAAGFLLTLCAKYNEAFAVWYSRHIYTAWVDTVGKVMGIFPFSVSEILLYLVLITILFTGVRLVWRLARKKDGVMKLTSWVGEKAPEAMKKLGERYPELSGYYPAPKGLLFPWILSVQKLSGIYSPITAEANYNSAMTDYNIPFTACHELSHLKGFMEEQEANFIAFLACTEETDEEFQYSGYMLGWIYCMNVLYDADYDIWQEVRETLCEEAEADLAANREFWAAYDGRVAEVANQVNDSYLKANGQEQGVESYDRMVDLIVVWYADQMKE